MTKTVMGCSMWLLGLAILALIASPVNAIPCQEATTKLLPCLAFLTGFGDITVPCCDAVKALNTIAAVKSERQSLCVCFEKSAAAFGVNFDKAKELPQLCKVDVPVPIDPKVDCSKV